MNPKRIDPAVTFDDQFFHMARDGFDDIPTYALPAGYRFRAYELGDDTAWIAIQRATEPFLDIPADLFEQQYGMNRPALHDRLWFVEDTNGTPVASISAWWEKDHTDPNDRGRIHWVVVHPEHQRRGLTKPMMTRALLRLAESHPSAMLGTSSGRPWAVKVYLDFGFHPEPAELENPEIVQGWRDVQSLLHHPRLEPWLTERCS